MPPATAQNSQQAQQNLQSFTQGMKSPSDVMNAANTQYGVGQAQQTVQGLRTSLQNTNNLLQQVAPGVMGRTQNSLVTDAQANRQIQNEQAPIQTNLQNLGQQYGNASQDYQSALGQASTLANAELGQQNQQESYLQGIYNDLYTQEQNAAQLAEQRREANLSASSSSGGASPSFGGAGAAGGAGGGGGTASRNAAGGYSFSQNGKPITMGQWMVGQGLSGQGLIDKAVEFLSNGTGGDKGIANAIRSGHYTAAQLDKLFPQVFGGI